MDYEDNRPLPIDACPPATLWWAGRVLMPGSSMPEYRIYTIGGDGRAWSAEDIEYRDDQEAIQKARWIVHGRDVELWKRGRFIARLPGTPRAVLASDHPLNVRDTSSLRHR